MTGKSQAEAVSILRNTKLGSTVKIVVSRQVVEEDDQFAVPRELVSLLGCTRVSLFARLCSTCLVKPVILYL